MMAGAHSRSKHGATRFNNQSSIYNKRESLKFIKIYSHLNLY